MFVLIELISCISGFLFGYDTGIINGAILFMSNDFHLSNYEKGLVVSLTVGGAYISSLFACYFSNIYGRKLVLIFTSVLFIIGSIILWFISFDLKYIYLGRFIEGLAVGASSMIAPMYVAEISPKESRGMLVTFVNVSITFGQLFATVLSALLSSVPHGWKLMLGLGAVPALIQLIGLIIFVPESPRWLIQQGHIDEARKSLYTLRSSTCQYIRINPDNVQRVDDVNRKLNPDGNVVSNAAIVESEFQELLKLVPIQEAKLQSQIFNKPELSGAQISSHFQTDRSDTCPNSQEGKHSTPVPNRCSQKQPSPFPPFQPVSDSVHHSAPLLTPLGKYRSPLTEVSNVIEHHNTLWPHQLLFCPTDSVVSHALIVGCLLQATQQVAGINTVMYYSSSILRLAGFSSDNQVVWLSVAVASCNFIGTLLGLAYIDKVGRRFLTLNSLAAVVLMLVVLALLFLFADMTSDPVTGSASDYSNLGVSSTCTSYTRCFDCVQDSYCGYCGDSTYTTSSLCLPRDIVTLYSNTSRRYLQASVTCAVDSYYETTCTGSALYGWAIFSALCVYLLCFAPGMGCTPWCVNGEIYPPHAKDGAVSLATATNWFSNFVMSLTFLPLVHVATRHGAFFIYASLSTVSLLALYWYMPETKGLSLEGIQVLFNDDFWGNASCDQTWSQRHFGRNGLGLGLTASGTTISARETSRYGLYETLHQFDSSSDEGLKEHDQSSAAPTRLLLSGGRVARPRGVNIRGTDDSLLDVSLDSVAYEAVLSSNLRYGDMPDKSVVISNGSSSSASASNSQGSYSVG